MTIHETIAELRVLMEKATPNYESKGNAIRGEALLQMGDIYADGRSLQMKACDADLIVAMRNSLPALLDRTDKLEEVARTAKEVTHNAFRHSPEEDDSHTAHYSTDVEPMEDLQMALARLDGGK